MKVAVSRVKVENQMRSRSSSPLESIFIWPAIARNACGACVRMTRIHAAAWQSILIIAINIVFNQGDLMARNIGNGRSALIYAFADLLLYRIRVNGFVNVNANVMNLKNMLFLCSEPIKL